MIPDLTPEQKFMLHRIAIETRDLSRDELIEELLGCWEARFVQKQAFLVASKDAGFVFKFNEGSAFLPATQDKDTDSFLCLCDEELEDDELEEVYESQSFELDMEAIVLDKED
ncbi:MAG: hypothetical protein MK127_08130 [Dehalococcoidia bacterium]|jgi:hypothetical protein|nr:hypothetical protein [Dehalococcoidia bacterium]|tara:strand:- start:482 stop:820 length:339 start_codon:yes stop_codon:yes gene_type:complete